MDLALEHKLKERNISVAYAQISEKGFITYYRGRYVLFLKEGLSEACENEVVLHELGHYDHDGEIVIYGNYKNNDRVRTVMENKANIAMLQKTLKNYLDDNDLSPNEINPVQFLQSYGLSMKLEDNIHGLLSM